MPKQLEILHAEPWFLQDEHRGYPIYYRYALCYSLAKLVIEDNQSSTETRKEIERLQVAIEQRKPYEHNAFVQLYPFTEDKGFVLVDQTNGYYPLVCYENKNRDDALRESVSDIISGFDGIYRKLKELRNRKSDWTPEFQQSLRTLFPNTI